MNIKHSSDFHHISEEKMNCRLICYIQKLRYNFILRKLKVQLFKKDF